MPPAPAVAQLPESAGNLMPEDFEHFERRLVEESSKLRLEMAELRTDVRGELGAIRTEIATALGAMRIDMATELGLLPSGSDSSWASRASSGFSCA
jgi:hypothetical protein